MKSHDVESKEAGHATNPPAEAAAAAASHDDNKDDKNRKATNNNDMLSDDEKRIQTDAQIKAIETEIRENQPLTSSLLPITVLVDTYACETSTSDDDDDGNGGSFVRGAQYLSTKYAHMRKVRGDGNCYYRAFLYGVCESVLTGLHEGDAKALKELDRFKALANSSLDEVTKHGYDRSALEMFHEELVDLFDFLCRATNADETKYCTLKELHEKLTEENATSEYCTWYLRVLTAAYLKSDPDRFLAFLDEPYADIATFCSREVEPMGRECGMVQVLALAETLGVDVTIEYLDGRDFDDTVGLTRHEFGPNASGKGKADTRVTLLYRPGHYDILY